MGDRGTKSWSRPGEEIHECESFDVTDEMVKKFNSLQNISSFE
jgi:hypothetical protein